MAGSRKVLWIDLGVFCVVSIDQRDLLGITNRHMLGTDPNQRSMLLVQLKQFERVLTIRNRVHPPEPRILGPKRARQLSETRRTGSVEKGYQNEDEGAHQRDLQP